MPVRSTAMHVVVLAAASFLVVACGESPSESNGQPRLEYVSGDDQQGSQGTMLQAPFVVRATDGHGVAYPGAEVRWTIIAGTGSPEDTVTRTDATGLASLTFRLAKRPGPAAIVARLVTAPNAEVRFEATAQLTESIVDTVSPTRPDTVVLTVSSGVRIFIPPGAFTARVEVQVGDIGINPADSGGRAAVELSIKSLTSGPGVEIGAPAGSAGPSGSIILGFPATQAARVLDVVWVATDLLSDPLAFVADATFDATQDLVLAYLNAVDAERLQVQYSRYDEPECEENYRLRSLDQPSRRALTVVLVHGWKLSEWRASFFRCSQFSQDVAASDFVELLRLHASGWLPAPYYGAATFTYPTYNSPEAAARKLADALGGVSGQVILVGHSMGGLVARRAAQLAEAGRVRGVLTLGTPHAGTPLALGKLPDDVPFQMIECLASHGVDVVGHSRGPMSPTSGVVDLLKLGLFLLALTEGVRALAPGSAFLTELNSDPFVHDVLLAGFAGDLSGTRPLSLFYALPYCALDVKWNEPANDGAVTVSSALPPIMRRADTIPDFDHTALREGSGHPDRDATYFEQLRQAIAMFAPAWIQGRVSSGGSPLAGISVRLLERDSDNDVASPRVTDAEGRYAFDLVEPGEYRLVLEDGGSRITDPYALTLVAGDIRTVDFPLNAAMVAFTSITAGGRHTCAIATTGAYCWGYNYYGQVGNDSNALSFTTPQRVVGTVEFASVTTGANHTCGIAVDGKAYCWGDNTGRQLGDGTFAPRGTPTAVLTSETFTSLSAGFDHTCGVTTAGVALCWGSNLFGQLGDGTTTPRSTPMPVAGDLVWRSVAAGQYFTCGLARTGSLYCWGSNPSGSAPEPDRSGLGYVSLAAGGGHVCGLTAPGAAYCRGGNLFGQLGNPTVVGGVDSMVPVASPVAFTSLTAGKYHTCGIVTDGSAYCWGYNFWGQLGNGTKANSQVPIQMVGGLSFSVLSGGEDHTCGVTASGVAYCWGSGGSGQLGTGSTSSSPLPVEVVPLVSATGVFGGPGRLRPR